MRTHLVALLAAVAFAFSTAPLSAHHGFAAEFDAKKPTKLRGTITRTEWINPHTWIHLAVKKPNGSVENWMIEGGPPNALFRRGFTRNSLPPGIEILVEGFQARDGTLRSNGREITLPDGRKLFVGTSNTGAPRDGRDATEK